MINAPLPGDKKWAKEGKEKGKETVGRERESRPRKWDRKSKQGRTEEIAMGDWRNEKYGRTLIYIKIKKKIIAYKINWFLIVALQNFSLQLFSFLNPLNLIPHYNVL